MIVVVGLSHRTAAIEIREALAIASDQVPDLLRQAVDLPPVREALLVSTCNRVELVLAGRNGGSSDLEDVARAGAGLLVERAPSVSRHLYRHHGGQAVRHLFRVAASLDSLVIGEPQILGQVKQAYETAQRVGTVGNCLHRAITRAIRTAKRVRSETSIGQGQVSVPSVAVDLAKQIFGDLTGRTVLLVGSGEMAETVARLLQHAGGRLLVIGRNEQRVEALANAVSGESRRWEDLLSAMTEADVVVSSTSAPHFVIDHASVKSIRRARRGRNLFFIDLAVPRDVDPEVGEIDGVFLYNVDDFSRIVAETVSSRRQEADRAEQIVAAEAAGYDRWAETTQVTPTIVALRERFQAVLEGELDRSLRGKLKHLGTDERSALLKMAEAAVNKLLHAPSTRLRKAAAEGAIEDRSLEQLHGALLELFALEQPAAEIDRAEDISLPPGDSTSDAEPEVSAAPHDHAIAAVRATGTTRR